MQSNKNKENDEKDKEDKLTMIIFMKIFHWKIIRTNQVSRVSRYQHMKLKIEYPNKQIKI